MLFFAKGLTKLLMALYIPILVVAVTSCQSSQQPQVIKEAKEAREVDPSKELHDRDSVGGPCFYSNYLGIATIMRIEKTEESIKQAKTFGGPGYEGYEVWFVFKTDQEIKEEWARASIEGEHLFQLDNSWYPGPQYLEKYNIKVGSSYPCTLKVRTKGTSTPIIFEFSQLKQDDYFEFYNIEKGRKK